MGNPYEWSKVKEIEENDDIAFDDVIPKKVSSKKQLILGRTQKESIPRKAWYQITDEKAADDSTKDRFVKSYFSVCVYELRNVKSLAIPMHQSINEQVTVSHTSSTRHTYATKFFIENILSVKVSGGTSAKGEVSDQLKTSYGIDTLDEYTSSSSQSRTTTETYSAIDKDRTVIWWDMVKVVLLYREGISGTIELLGVSDYLCDSTKQTYVRD